MNEVATMLEAPVARVTVLEDRAQVTRSGRVRLGAGSHRLRVEGASPVIADRTLVARGSDGVRVDETRVVRQWRIGAEARPPDARAIVEEYRKQMAVMVEARALHELLVADEEASDQAIETVLAAINRELPFAEAYAPRWAEDLERVMADARAALEATHDSQARLDELRARLATVIARATTGWRIDYDLVSELVLDVTVASAGEHELTIEYVLPCAAWRPIHRGALDVAGKRLQLASEAAVWQATGEDWVDVELAFSTARPTQRAEPPTLADDRLRVQKKVDNKVVIEVREQAIATTGEGASASVPELQGVDDGGETRLMRAPTRATVRADGRMQRVPLFGFEAAVEVDRIARPEVSPLVHVRTRQDNLAPHPLLAGPIELMRHGMYVGVAELGYVAPGERFVLGWGGDEAVRVGRRASETREVGRVFGKQTVTRTVELFLSNLDDTPAEFRLEERVPVSEIADVTVEVDPRETRPTAAADDQGIVAWSVKLAPLGSAEVKLLYRLLAGSDVVL
ncbi:MAG: DUF4139 domain-containing protein [Deltaproteobacteria bacterium]|nr:DUF4139 domain-containing protein [Deltaproteobacteria bacterium]